MNLEGRTFISTASAQKSEKMKAVFEPLGARVIDFPMIEIRASDPASEILHALAVIDQYDWIIFTSGNGVKHFIRLWNGMYPRARIPSRIKLAAIGKQTAHQLEHAGYRANFTGSGNTAMDLATELIEMTLVQNTRILLPLGNLAPTALEQRLASVAEITRIDVYHTLRTAGIDKDIIDRIINDAYDLIIFTSPSAVDHFAEVMHPFNLTNILRTACIGPVTADAATSYGYPSLVTAEKSSYEGLAHEIDIYYNP